MPTTDSVSEVVAEMVACDHCGNETESTVDVSGEDWCQSCADDDSVRCDHCGDRVDTADTCQVAGSTWCESCVDDDSGTCDRCGDRVHIDDTHRVNDDDTWCQHCVERAAFTCEDCDECYDEDACNVTHNGRRICDGCRSDGYSRCDSCDELYPYDQMCDGYCEGCYEPEDEDEDDDTSALIRKYHNSPKPIFYGTGIHFGLELEVEVNGSIQEQAEYVVGALGHSHAYLMQDGSINHGFEIITHPHTLDEHRKLWDKWQALRGMKSHDTTTCGIHVHIEKQHLSALQIGKILVFVNAEDNAPFIKSIAQRDSSSYANRSPKKITCKCSESRYEAVNLATCKPTIELRIFRGNVRRERILKALEFAAALAEWTKLASCRRLHYEEFVSFVRDSRKTYPNLFAYLVEKQWSKPASKPNPNRPVSIAKEDQ